MLVMASTIRLLIACVVYMLQCTNLQLAVFDANDASSESYCPYNNIIVQEVPPFLCIISMETLKLTLVTESAKGK